MKVLKAKILKDSIHYHKGLNQKGQPVWLSIVGFNPQGIHNYKIKAIKAIKNGFAEYIEIWMRPDEIKLKQHEDSQLSLEIFSPQELEENRHNPRYYNQNRYEVTSKNTKYFFYGPNLETVEKVARQYKISKFSIKQVRRLNKEELNE
jgi:hypothetical protein